MFTGWCIPLAKLRAREVVLFAMLGAMTFGAKYVMAFLPNIEPVSLLVMVYAVVLGKKAAWPIGCYVTLEILFYGLGLWNICYLYVWAVLAVEAYCLRHMEGRLGWAVLSGGFGLLFGALCGIVDVFVGGPAYAAAKWISGIPFDLAHCAGNFVLALVLFVPLRDLLEKLWHQGTLH